MEYTYQDLPGADYIRLLLVEPPNSFEDDIHCSLRTARMSDDRSYAALSYTWGMDADGEASLSRRIVIDGKTLQVTRNLFEGLQQIFITHRIRRPIWIDAVCINQRNSQERSSQVAQMGQIFANASRVICWLGNGATKVDDDNIRCFLECFGSPQHSHFREHQIASRDGNGTYLCLAQASASAYNALSASYKRNYDTSVCRIPECVRKLFGFHSLALATHQVQEIVALLNRKRYWRRRWILQELCHARRPVLVLWGDHVVREKIFHRALELALVFSGLVLEAFSGLQVDPWQREEPLVWPLLSKRRAFSEGKVRDMLYFMETSYSLECSEPRDLVYSLLSLDPATALQADYNMTLDNVYKSFWIDVLQRNHNRLPLMLCNSARQFQWTARPYNDEISKSLPSWCPDLRHRLFVTGVESGLGDWEIDASGRLHCLALVIGWLNHSLNRVYSRSAGAAEASGKDAPLVESAHVRVGKSCRPGDLVCFFDDRYGLYTTGEGFRLAIVLHLVSDEEVIYSIVGYAIFLDAQPEPEGGALGRIIIV